MNWVRGWALFMIVGVTAFAQSATMTIGRGPEISSAKDGELLGVLSYKGGYVQRISIALNPPSLVKNFRVQVPSFCKNVDVLEAGTRTEGIEDVAKLLNKQNHEYAVNGGHGERVGSVFVTLNGPENLSCNIPIYSVDKTTGGDGEGDGIQGTFGENGKASIRIGEFNRIVMSTYQINNLQTGESSPITWTTALQPMGGRRYRAAGTWTYRAVLFTGQSIFCNMPAYSDLMFSSSYGTVDLTLTYPKQVQVTTLGCTYVMGSDTHFLERQ